MIKFTSAVTVSFFLSLLMMVFSGYTTFAQMQKPAKLYSFVEKLPQSRMPYKYTIHKKKKWKQVGQPQKFISNGSNYIKRPKSNPNLIQQIKEKKRLAALQEQREKQRQAKAHKRELRQMCMFAAQSRRRRGGFTVGGPMVITSHYVMPRKVVSFAEYRKECSNFYTQNRYAYSNGRYNF